MNILQIISERAHETWPSYDLIYEWEDILARELEAQLYLTSGKERKYKRVPFISHFLLSNKESFMFHLTTYLYWYAHKSNIVPCIIDFYCKSKSSLRLFYWFYKKHPLVLISSKEVYDFLCSVKCPLKIAHFPLSISDKYRISKETTFVKKFDLVMMGRVNPVLAEYVYKYAESHPNFYYVYRVKAGGTFSYYTNKGEALGDINTRDQYMKLMSQSRVGLYSVPGIDDDGTQTNGFHQVTPRFLELLVNGCHVLGRYIDNADTDYYKLRSICPNITDYESFEKNMDNALCNQVDMKKYSDYLNMHYTSVRAEQLIKILSTK